jgi:tryptophan-rich sensory protein
MLVRHSILVSLGVCALAATAEGILSGRRPLQVLATLRLPRFTPPRFVWILIGILYYAIGFAVLTRVLEMDGVRRLQYSAVVLITLLLVLNASFNYLLFKLRNLAAAFVVLFRMILLLWRFKCVFFVWTTSLDTCSSHTLFIWRLLT